MKASVTQEEAEGTKTVSSSMHPFHSNKKTMTLRDEDSLPIICNMRKRQEGNNCA